jgi:invasion protein IalB
MVEESIRGITLHQQERARWQPNLKPSRSTIDAFVKRAGRLMPRSAIVFILAAVVAGAVALSVFVLPGEAAGPDVAAGAASRVAGTAGPTSALPGGASSLHEIYQDWSVTCVQQGAGKRCTMSQQQSDAQSHLRTLAIELGGMSSDTANGILILPFGLAVDNGVTLQIDDGAIGTNLKFRTCLPSGCVVLLSFDARTLAALRRATVLKARATADGGGETAFSVSLKGFGSAFDRTAALAR